jgi:hypothetical protein
MASPNAIQMSAEKYYAQMLKHAIVNKIDNRFASTNPASSAEILPRHIAQRFF